MFLHSQLSAQETYFPKGVLSSDARGDLFRANWYSKHLKALEEPSLLGLAKNPSLQSYRFVWLRTFHHPVIVRLDIMADGTGDLTVKVASGAGGYGKRSHIAMLRYFQWRASFLTLKTKIITLLLWAC